MKRILLIALLLAGTVAAEFDNTPYDHAFGGNCPTGSGTNNASIAWLAQHYDWSAAGSVNHRAIRDTALAHSKVYHDGKYSSSQELYCSHSADADKTETYAARLLDTANHWLFIFAREYAIAKGAHESVLVVHYGDSMISLTQQSGGSRKILVNGLKEGQRRFTYQMWNNDATDTFAYPSGYTWVANGYNDTTRWAIADAFRKRWFENATKYDTDTVSALFMDNQFRDTLGAMGYMPTMSTYYTIDSTRDGATTAMDWQEQHYLRAISGDGYKGYDSCTKYFDHSTAMIDSCIKKMFDSMATVTGHQIYIEANVNHLRSQNLAAVAPHVHCVELEKCGDYDAKHPTWTEWHKFDSIMITYFPGTKINWQTSVQRMLSSSPSAWNYDSNWVYYGNYAFLMSVYDTNSIFSINYYYDTTWWRNIYEVDFGTPTGFAIPSDTTGTGDTTKFVWKRKYIKGADTNIVVFRTGPMAQASVNDSIFVSLGGNYYKVDVDGDTAASMVSSIYLHPFDGWFGVTNNTGVSDPVIACSPSQLSFEAYEGGSNPADQTLSISNSGGGTLAWTITDLTTWLSESPTTGGNSEAVTTSVSISGLSAGIYKDTISITDAAATNSPYKIPVELTVNSMPVGVEGRVLRGKVYLKGKVKI